MLIPPSVFQLIGAATKDPGRGCLQGLRLERTADGPRAIAIEGCYLAIARWDEDPAEDFPDRGLDTRPAGLFGATIPPDACKRAAKLAPSRPYRQILRNVALGEQNVNGTVTLLGTNIDTDARLETKTLEGDYPTPCDHKATAGILDGTRSAVASVTIELGCLATLVNTLAAAAPAANKDVDRPVTLSIYDPGDPIKIETHGPRAEVRVTGLLMPMMLSKT